MSNPIRMATRIRAISRALSQGRAKTYTFRGVVVDHAASSWAAGGFELGSIAHGARTVPTVNLGGCTVVFRETTTSPRRGLLGVVILDSEGNPPSSTAYGYGAPEFLPGVPFMGVAALGGTLAPSSVSHKNGVIGLGELVIWHHGDIDAAVSNLETFGLFTYKNRPAKQLGVLKVARFFFGDVRVLLVGPADATGGALDKTPNVMSWMIGREGEGKSDMTGALLLVSSLDGVAQSTQQNIGPPKAAQQPGRQICTAPRGDDVDSTSGFSCTLAFITDPGPTPLFQR